MKKQDIKNILNKKQKTLKQRLAIIKALENTDEALIVFNGGCIFSFDVYLDDIYNQAVASLSTFDRGDGEFYYDITNDKEWNDFIKYVGRVNNFCNNK